jgi:hypothetical protein
MKVVYIAGPFRCPSLACPGQQDHFGIHQNVTRAMALALEVWRLGAVALCPHGNTFCLQHSAPDSVWLEGDMELMRRCDAVLMVPGWSDSRGAIAERLHARERGMPVFETLSECAAWLRL